MVKDKDINNYWITQRSFVIEKNNLLLGFKKKLNATQFSKHFLGGNLYLFAEEKLFDENLNILAKALKSENIVPLGNEYFMSFSRTGELNKFTIIFKNRIIWDVIDDSRSINPVSELLFRIDYSTTSIFKRDINTGQTLWHFSVSELGRWIDMGEEREGKIIGPIVECNGVLIMGVSGNRIIGLEKNTGKLLWNNHYPVSGSSYLVYNDEAYTCNESFCILNPHSGEENSLFPFYSVFDKYKAQAYGKRLITDKYIINVGQLDCIVMVFDKKSGEVVWRHEIYPPKKTGRRGITLKGDILDPVQYHQGKLYVLTSDKILHVFDVR